MSALVQVSSQAAVAGAAAEDAPSGAGMQGGGHAHPAKHSALACMDLCMTHAHLRQGSIRTEARYILSRGHLCIPGRYKPHAVS